MSEYQQTEPIDANHAQHSVCGHCGGGTTHETWCITCNIVVRYAYGIVMDAHAPLRVRWFPLAGCSCEPTSHSQLQAGRLFVTVGCYFCGARESECVAQQWS